MGMIWHSSDVKLSTIFPEAHECRFMKFWVNSSSSFRPSKLWPESPFPPKGGAVLDGVCYQIDRPSIALKKKEYWPTPTAHESGRTLEQFQENKTRGTKLGGMGLSIAVQQRSQNEKNEYWPTPRTRHLCGGTGAHENLKKRLKEGLITQQEFSAMRGGGALNPVWVEWLMGFPLNWSKADEKFHIKNAIGK